MRTSPFSGETVTRPQQVGRIDYQSKYETEKARCAVLEGQLEEERGMRQSTEEQLAGEKAECERLEAKCASLEKEIAAAGQALRQAHTAQVEAAERTGDLRAALARSEATLEAAVEARKKAETSFKREADARIALERRLIEMAQPVQQPLFPPPELHGWKIDVMKDGADVTRQLVLTPMEK